MLVMLLVAAAPAGVVNHACPANSTNRQSVNPHIIVQGGIKPDADPQALLAIGPKQDDPAQPKPSVGDGRSLLAIGPKQDDPAQPKPSAGGGRSLLAIGPKQDDPVQPKPSGNRLLSSRAMDDCGTVPAPVPVPH